MEIIKEATQLLKEFAVPYEIDIISAHRIPQRAYEYASTAEERGIQVIITAAGGSAHLAGVMASWTSPVVIGVPIPTQLLGGLDSLLSMVEIPSGVPVATVALGKAGAKNSALLAMQILGVKYPEIREKIKKYKEKMIQEIEEKTKRLRETFNYFS